MSEHSCPTGWQVVRLGDVCEIITKGTTPNHRGFEYQSEGVTFVKIESIGDDGKFIPEKLTHIDKKCHNALKRSQIRANDLLLSIAGALGRRAIASAALLPANTNQAVAIIRLRQDAPIDLRFLNYFVVGPQIRHYIERINVQSAQANISLANVNDFPIAIPSFNQQRKIAKILTTVDNLIEKTEALIAKYQAIKQGMMHDLFTRGVDENGHLRPSYEEAPELYKQSELGWIPREWKCDSLGSISTSMTNGFVGVATPFYTDDGTGIPYLYGNNVRIHTLDLPTKVRVTRQFHESQKKSQLQPGDMLTVQSGHIGTSAIVPASLGEANCHALIITKLRREKTDPAFVSLYCNSPLGMQRMSSIFVGSTVKHINVKEFKNFFLPMPTSCYEQTEMCGRLESVSRSIEGEIHQVIKLREIKSGLMQDLLMGKIRVKVDESEEVAHDPC
ncbi:MAG: restriction endonuclease subunit S [Planctomycetota bacterium]